MKIVTSESELVGCFREIDRADVLFAPELAFPLVVDDVVAWAVGPRAFLLFVDPIVEGRADRPPRGIVFHRNAGAIPDVAAMCEWCHAVRGHGGVKLMSVASGERRSLGLYLCSDLGCVARARALPGLDDPPHLDGDARVGERAGRTLQRIFDFAARRLF